MDNIDARIAEFKYIPISGAKRVFIIQEFAQEGIPLAIEEYGIVFPRKNRPEGQKKCYFLRPKQGIIIEEEGTCVAKIQMGNIQELLREEKGGFQCIKLVMRPIRIVGKTDAEEVVDADVVLREIDIFENTLSVNTKTRLLNKMRSPEFLKLYGRIKVMRPDRTSVILEKEGFLRRFVHVSRIKNIKADLGENGLVNLTIIPQGS
jgi:hypothetical protein